MKFRDKIKIIIQTEMRTKQIMKEMYAQLGISSEVYDFGHKIEESLKERFEKFDKTKSMIP